MISPPNTHPSSSPRTLAAVTYPISHLPPESPPCGGRLQFFIGGWSKITQDPWVLQVVRGYQLDFSSYPPLHRPRYTQLALARDQKQAMEAEIQSLLEKQAIVRLTPPLSPGFYSSVFVVPKKDGGWRPIINLRELNRSDWRFLRFSWEEEYYQFKTLPFGLTSAPYVFTKLLRPVASLFRQAGLRILVYLDDWLLLASDPDLLKDQGEHVSSNLQSLGFLLNHKKCIMVPTQSIEFLGFIIDSRRMTLSLPAVKVDKIHKECRHILNLSEVTGRQLSHIIGLMTSVLPAIHPAFTLQSPSAPKAESPGTEGVPRLRFLCEAFIRSSRRSTVVDPLAPSSQRTAYLFARTDTGSRVGRLQEGLGSPLQRERHIDRGTLDSRRITSTHQLARIKSSLPCHSNVCETSMSCSNFSRQPSGSCVHKSDGGDTLSAAVQAGSRVLGLVHETSDHNSCGAPARQIECARRLRVPPPIRLQRLETESRDLFTTECLVWSFYDRPVCLTLEQASEPFFQLEARSAGIGSGCSGSLMGSRAPICISPLRSNWSLPAESMQRAYEITTADSPNLASPNLVPSPTVNAEQQSSDPPIISRPTPESSAGATPVDPERPSYASRVAHIWNMVSNQGISQESADIICKSWRKGTAKSYESAWKRWVSWCDRRNTNPLSASLADILQFLTDLYKEGKEYSNVSIHTAQLSQCLIWALMEW